MDLFKDDVFGNFFESEQNEHNKKDSNFDNENEYYDNLDKGLNDNKTLKSNRSYISKEVKADYIKKLKKENINSVITELPKKNVYHHIVSNGTFDYFGIIPRILELENGDFELYASTWTMNFKNTETLLNLYDVRRLTKITFICGDYLVSREPLVFNTIKEGLLERKQRIKPFKNHAKIILLSNGINYYVCEGSANFTANPRVEQNLICNSKDLYNFHKEWIEELFI